MIKACFSNDYFAATPTASMRKLPPVTRAAEQGGYAQLVSPGAIDLAMLRRLHDPEYVQAFISGEGPLASSQGWPWTKQIRDGVLAMNAGQLVAAQNALRDGIAANVAQGFHHACHSSGGGYCTFNGLALVAQEFPKLKVCVLDCDEHGGNGTEEFTRRLPNLFNITINGSTFGCRTSDRSVSINLCPVTESFNLYRSALHTGFDWIRRWQPDLLIYQAGADPHLDDPLGTLGMTTAQLFEREQEVFRFCKASRLPTFFVLAGGYQEPLEEKLVPLHVNTFRAAHEIYFGAARAPSFSS